MKCDILIVGGGTGGVAAAMAATSLGQRVILTEPTAWLGGQLTSQAVPPDENMSIEKFGCTARYRRFRNGVRQYYRDNYPLTAEARREEFLNPGGGYVSKLCFEPRVGVQVIEAMLAWPRARGLLEVRHFREPIGATTDGDRISSVSFRHLHSGAIETVEAGYIIDATELGDVLPLANIEYVSGAESQAETDEPHAPEHAQPDNVQSMTWCFPLAWDPAPGAAHLIDKPLQYEKWRDYAPQTNPPYGGKLLGWEFNNERGEPKERALFLRPGLPPQWFRGLWGYRQIVTAQHYPEAERPHEVTLVNWPQNDYFARNPIDKSSAEVAEIFEEAKQLSLSLVHWVQTEAPRLEGGVGYPELYIPPGMMGTVDGLAMFPYIRESRRIRAEFTVTENHVSREVRGDRGSERFHDSVGIGAYMIDLHVTTTGDRGISAPTSPFQIPLGSLIPVRAENLLAGGKNLGVTHIANGCYRLHPIEWNIGEAAGLLAAHCLQQNQSPRAVRNDEFLLRDFRRLLEIQGVELEWPRIA